MKKPKLTILAMDPAEDLSETTDVRTAFVSITSPEGEEADLDESNPNVVGIFRMKFPDEDYGSPDSFEKPKAENFEGLAEFAEFVEKSDVDLLVVHCEAGISRSAAVAAALSERLGLGVDVWRERRLHPNLLVYKLACAELGIGRTKEDLERAFAVRKEVSMWEI